MPFCLPDLNRTTSCGPETPEPGAGHLHPHAPRAERRVEAPHERGHDPRARAGAALQVTQVEDRAGASGVRVAQFALDRREHPDDVLAVLGDERVDRAQPPEEREVVPAVVDLEVVRAERVAHSALDRGDARPVLLLLPGVEASRAKHGLPRPGVEAA